MENRGGFILKSCRKTSFGFLTVTERNNAIAAIAFADPPPRGESPSPETETPLLKEAFRQLEEYFTGKRKDFDLPLDPEGTPFMKRVWKRLLEIPYGKTASYREIAVSIGIPGGMRAVGLASHRNPIPVIIPCHRVIGSDGRLVGYAGGLSLKRRLLALEAEHAPPDPESEGTTQETISGK